MRAFALAVLCSSALVVTGCASLLAPLQPQSQGLEQRRATPEDRADALPAAPAGPSRSVGLPWSGRPDGGVRVPASGPDHVTWDPVLRRSPNRGWRRFGTFATVRTVLRVVADHRRAHPSAPRVVIGDLSRPKGGDFGARYGLPGHASHQSGVDVDVYLPRRDGRATTPQSAGQVDRRRSRDLLRRFLRAGAGVIFISPEAGVHDQDRRVRHIPNHDTHMHVRFGPVHPG
jgi:murein endopeptidase